MQLAQLAQCDQLTSAHVTDLSHLGVIVVMVTTQFPDVAVAAVPHSRPSKPRVRQQVRLSHFHRYLGTDLTPQKAQINLPLTLMED